jgi:hypothetical protein
MPMSAPCGERLFAAGQHDCADVLVGVERLERGAQFVHERVVQRVQRLGAIKRDESNPITRFDQQILVSHSLLPLYPQVSPNEKTSSQHLDNANITNQPVG